MAKKREVVKINDKEYVFNELTVGQIIELIQDNKFFKDPLKSAGVEKQKDIKEEAVEEKKEEKSFSEEIAEMVGVFRRIADASCEFDISKELKSLAPSEIKKLYEDGFKKANSDFFFILGELGILEWMSNVKDQMVAVFSRTLVT